MFLSIDKTIEDQILEALKDGPLRTTEVLKLIPATKQGIYRVLRLLKKEEVIVIHNKQVSLNIRWLDKLDNFLSLAEQRAGHFANLQEGEKIKYVFNNLNLTDAFWNHSLYILLERSRPKDNWFAYSPHVWFFLARSEDEKALMRSINKRDKLYLLTSGNKKPMDRVVAKEVDGKMSQYSMLDKPLFEKNNYYVNVIGDFLIEVYFDQKITQEIEEWYDQVEPDVEELRKIVGKKGRTRLVISHNKKKAARLRKRLMKNFYIPKKYTTKAIIFDADGVTIDTEMFSVQYQKDFGVPAEEITPFFTGVFGKCKTGEADLKEELQPWLKKWKWEKSVDEFLEYWFKEEHHLNDQIIGEVKKLRAQGTKCFLATNQEKYRLKYLREEMKMDEIFDGVICSAEVGAEKPSDKFFEEVLNKAGAQKEEIVWWDDDQEVVDGANEFGFKAYLYTGFDDFLSKVLTK